MQLMSECTKTSKVTDLVIYSVGKSLKSPSRQPKRASAFCTTLRLYKRFQTPFMIQMTTWGN